MAKRPDTSETVRIVLEILRRIPRTHKVTASDLHAQLVVAGFDRNLRTVQRHLDALVEGFDIECDDRSKPYGYRWRKGAPTFSLPGLNEQESLLLALAAEHLRNLLPARTTSSLEAFFEQAQINLGPMTKAPKEREWLSKVRVVATTQPLLPPAISPGVFEQVSNALYGNFWLYVTYKNAAGKSSKTEVMPLGIAQQGPRLYLVCRFRDFQDDRTLAVHRITRARASTLTFDRPKDFDLRQFDDEGRFAFGTGRQVRLRFRIEKAAGLHLLESPLSIDQAVKVLRDCYEITATVMHSEQLTWWLRSFGDAVWGVAKDSHPAGATKTRGTL